MTIDRCRTRWRTGCCSSRRTGLRHAL